MARTRGRSTVRFRQITISLPADDLAELDRLAKAEMASRTLVARQVMRRGLRAPRDDDRREAS
jgi:metal-responsive CopG/Arc/MetJ family transcriptional regulator